MNLRYLCLAGPTASGKTAAALSLAESLARPVEIVSVDSALVYRGMDIGSAKPSAAERAAVPHHLIDLIEPSQSYSAARFVHDANAAMAAIRARGALPLLVGGTMLYFKALFDGLDALPSAPPALRAALAERAAREGWPALHAELAKIDPITAQRLAANDAQRISRALEVWQASGRPLSSFHSGRFEGEATAPQDTALISLEPTERAWLHARIAQRFDAMLASGFIDELRALRARGDLHAELPSMRCVGYRQGWEQLERHDPPDLAVLRETGIAATRQLAKRQLTWLRAMPWRHVVPAEAADAPAQATALARRLLGEAAP
ncbi:tRNA (adenosine(37)-N6)-dimethylallyltransferase MiaA [Rivibacter subsaxonicus]|uniref:tRNA dimethylallyltransferase n=1 Tax=Rivibacter subsaxonicus TaxID=457575 RepID=A0A4Q7W1M2_9BURK|nr:tRNA (adenosine(37)-N6)-dimethylallyltransferase MiaA [Rivibacter subsaxonicus]RZU03151.1 tRNA dimethylallyltransferase [Rivibacter subsaxonicus]